jgi:spore coat polysaccharide biosynthesis predicted glycosyltransferase SpsG
LKIIILTDGNNKIGMGHVYRSLNLSIILKNDGHDIIFLTNEESTKKIISNSNECKFIKNISQIQLKKYLRKISPDIIIIDKLNETKNNLETLKKNGPIIGIDYTGKHKELFDYGINILYPKSGISTKSFSGLNYAILNTKFKNIKKKKIMKKVKSVLILQGGADTHCFTPKIIKAVNGLNGDFKISIVLGPSFKCWLKLNETLKIVEKQIKVYHNVKDMANLMQKHDFAITAAGNTLLELAHLGIPSAMICAEKFEVETSKLVESKGFGINIGFGKDLTILQIQKELSKIIMNYSLRKKMNVIGPKLVDGKGSIRVSRVLSSKIS